MPRLGITPDRLAGASRGKLARRIALPFFMLAADRGDLDRAVALSGGTERGARLDRLKLLGIADQHDLGALLLGFGHDTLKLARPDHASLLDDADLFPRPPLPVLPPLILEACQR